MPKNFQFIKFSRSAEVIGAFQHTSKYYLKTVTLEKHWQESARNYNNGQKYHPIIPFTGEKEKWRMWSVKFMAGAVIKGYYVLITGNKKIPTDDID